MKQRKRAPGGGRKPQGEYANRTASFTMRMSRELRDRLDQEVDRSGWALSQEVEHRLRQSLDWPIEIQKKWGPPHIKALAQLVSRAARAVETGVGVNPLSMALNDGLAWHRNGFTHAALTTAVNAILEHFKPPQEFSVPKAVEDRSALFARVNPGHSAERYCTPEEVGLAYAGGLIDQLITMELPPLDKPSNEIYAEEYSVMPQIQKDLGIEYDKLDGRDVGLSRTPKRRVKGGP